METSGVVIKWTQDHPAIFSNEYKLQIFFHAKGIIHHHVHEGLGVFPVP